MIEVDTKEGSVLKPDFQNKVLACLVRIPEFNAVARQYLEPSYFEGVVEKNVAKMILDYSRKYESCIGPHEFSMLLADCIKKKIIKPEDLKIYSGFFKSLYAEDVTGWKYYLDHLITFIKRIKTKALIEDCVKKYLPKDNFEAFEKQAGEIFAIRAMEEVEPYDVFSEEAIRAREIYREEMMAVEMSGISTGIKKMDDHLYRRGFWPKELYMIMAGPKRGKTMALLWFSNCCALQSKVCAHFSCEVSREVCADRIDSMNTDIPLRELAMNSELVSDRLASRGIGGKLFIYEYPTKRLTIPEIDRQLLKLQIKYGVKVDMLTVDYLDILRPTRRYNDPWFEQAGLAEDLRALGKKYVIPVVTATQINRVGSRKHLAVGSDVAGSFEKVMIADEVITLGATEDEMKEGKLRVHFSESRNSGKATFVINTGFALGKFYESFVEEEV